MTSAYVYDQFPLGTQRIREGTQTIFKSDGTVRITAGQCSDNIAPFIASFIAAGTTVIQTVPATDADLDTAWRSGNADADAAKRDAAIPLLNQYEIPLQLKDAPATVQIPATLQSPHVATTTTETKVDGTTSTTTRDAWQTATNTVTGDRYGTQTITSTITNNYTTTNQAGDVTTNVEQVQDAKPVEQPKPPPDPVAPGLPQIPQARTFQQSIDVARNSFSASPLAAATNGLHIPTGGVCPTAVISIPYLHGSWTMNSHCAIGDAIRPTLQAFFLAFWVLTAVFVFLRP